MMDEREKTVNRKISICILSFIIVLLLLYAASLLWQERKDVPLELSDARVENIMETTELAVPISKTEEPFIYIMYVVDGMLTVFEKDGKTVYLDTGIEARYLPVELRERLEEGIRFPTEKDLFDFLESYSS